MVSNKKLICEIVVWFIIFFSMVLLYTKISPVMVGDADDWTYISYSRQALLDWGGWNPAKIFPETFMGLCGNIAAFLIYPITKDYLYSMTYMYGFIIALFVMGYLILFKRLIRRCFPFGNYESMAVVIIFLASHFLLFKSRTSNNVYMLISGSLNRTMNYLIPMLFSAGLFFYIACEIQSKHKAKYTTGGGGILFLCLYLVIFSNMAVNIIFIAPVCIRFLIKIVQQIKRQKKLKCSEIAKEYFDYIVVFLMEIVCLLGEASGGRSQSLEFDLTEHLQMVIADWKTIWGTIEYSYFFVSLSLNCIAIMIFLVRQKGNKQNEYDCIIMKLYCWCMASFVICIIYVTTLYIRIGEHKLARIDNISVIFLYYIICTAIASAYIIYSMQKIRIFIPLIIYVTFFSIVNISSIRGNYFTDGGSIYAGAYSGFYTAEECYKAGNEVILQIISADKKGLNEITIEGPWIISQENWMGNRVSKTLFRHGIISRQINVQIVHKE